MTRRQERRATNTTEQVLLYSAVAAAVAVAVAVWVGWVAGGGPAHVNPIALPIELVTGRRAWPGAWSTLVAAAIVAVFGAGLALFAARTSTGVGGRTDRHLRSRARLLGGPGDINDLTGGAARKAARLAPALRDGHGRQHVGLPIGRTLNGGAAVTQSWEDTAAVVAGTRRGKSTAFVVPKIAAAGRVPVLAAGNKRDVLDATSDLRGRHGRVWVFDPQQLAGTLPQFYFNPVDGVATKAAAEELVAIFTLAVRRADRDADSYFDQDAGDYLACLILAAGLDGGTLLDVYRWVLDDVNDRVTVPAILRAAGEEFPAQKVEAVYRYPDKQRLGVTATAALLLRVVGNRESWPWITPGGDRERFDPAGFVTSTDTLYLLGQEGTDSAGALVAALVQSCFEAGIRASAASRGGRLNPPLVAELDEAANICRLPKLPAQYSHFGSRGVVVSTYLQSWSQGQAVWGDRGMRALWDAATLRVYGGGAADDKFLDSISRLAGEHTVIDAAHSRSRYGPSVSDSRTRERTLDVAQLAGLPLGRAVLIPSVGPVTVLATQPWQDGLHAHRIRASIAEAAQ